MQAGVYFLAASLIWFAGRRSGRVSALWVFVSSVLLGWMVVTEYPTAVLVPFLGGYAIFVLREQRRLSEWRLYAIAAAGGLLAVAPLLWYNAQVFGHPLTTGYQHHATAKFAAAHAVGVAGIGPPDPIVMLAMTVHPLMGIFWQSPVLLLAVPGWMTMWKRGWRAEACLAFAVCVSYLALMSGYYDWSGGLSYTPRHLIPLFAVFAIPLAFVPQRWMALGWCLAAISIAQHLIAVAGRWEYMFRMIRRTLDEQGHPTLFFVSTIWSAIWPNIQNGLLVRNRGTLIMPSGDRDPHPAFRRRSGPGHRAAARDCGTRSAVRTPTRGLRWSAPVIGELANGPSRSAGGASSFPVRTHALFVRRTRAARNLDSIGPKNCSALGGTTRFKGLSLPCCVSRRDDAPAARAGQSRNPRSLEAAG